MELLRDYHAMFWAFFFFSNPPPTPLFDFKSDSVSVFHSHFSPRTWAVHLKMFSLVFLSYTSLRKQREKSKTKSGYSWTGFPRRKKKEKEKPKEKHFSFISLFKKNNSLVNFAVKELKHERTMLKSFDFGFRLALYLDVFLGEEIHYWYFTCSNWSKVSHHLYFLVPLLFVKINSGLFHSL